MAGIDASIPLQAKKPDTFGRISDLVNMQRNQVALQADKTALQGAQQSQRQRSNLASFDVQKIIDPMTGEIDLNRIPGSGLREAAVDQFPEVLSQYTAIKQQQLAAKHALTQLTGDQRSAFSEMMGALRADPEVSQDRPEGRQKVLQEVGRFQQMYPDAKAVVEAYLLPLTNSPQGKLPQVLQNIQLQATSAGDQATRQTPNYQYASTGARDVLMQVNPNAPGGAQMPGIITKELSPGERFPLATNAAGQMVRPDRVTGNISLMGGANPTAAQAEMQGANAPRIQQAVTEAAAVPQVRNVLQNIIRLADTVETGPKSEQVNRIKAMVGNVVPGANSWKDSTSAYQEMTKYMEQLALRSWQSAGGSGTNSQLEAQVRANPNNEYNSKTVKELAKWVLAGEEAKLAKTKTMMRWLQQPGNSVNNAEQFEVQWADAMDPRVFQLHTMTPEEIKKKFSAEERKDIRKSYEKLKALGAVE